MGVNQRASIQMTDEEIASFVERSRTCTLATIGPSGTPHLVAMWYAVLDEHVWIETKRKSQKVANLRRDPRMSFLVETGDTYDQLRGVAMEGRGEVVDDEAVVWDVCVNIFERYNAPYTDELKPFVELMAHNRVAVRLDVERTRSWDHRKLGLDPIELGGTTARSVAQQ